MTRTCAARPATQTFCGRDRDKRNVCHQYCNSRMRETQGSGTSRRHSGEGVGGWVAGQFCEGEMHNFACNPMPKQVARSKSM